MKALSCFWDKYLYTYSEKCLGDSMLNSTVKERLEEPTSPTTIPCITLIHGQYFLGKNTTTWHC